MKDKLERVLRSLGYDKVLLVMVGNGPDALVGGHIVSPKFEGKSQIKRQYELWGELEKRLTKDERANIVALLTMTPGEIE